MKIYDSLNVELTFQSLGAQWLMILEGKEEEIELAYNGIFNFCAVKSPRKCLFYENTSHTIATFYSNEDQMRNYFRLISWIKDEDDMKAEIYSQMKMNELEASPRTFRRFMKPADYSVYQTGQSCAERPDLDGKDLVVNQAFGQVQEGIRVFNLEDDEEKPELRFVSVQKPVEEPENEIKEMFDNLQAA